ncbi:NAD-dependent oxidoreductase [Sphingobium sp. SCG-1]|uniref:SDR family NAD(P)-dependent oxidoreductase n=1 Tax=Sphingobium sp. SCG-1 TaxID=2072936 RepID=UPI000CD67972|nr:SDR family NAD(P)-dependent oxidoreductase [Sphingobium sp. SCG-1]AUW57164.1 NAD-dependent oxidoreductase [Sphingobium sp. SCG-1]
MISRTVIVTGGFGILGRAVANAFAAQGEIVVRVDYAPAPEEALPKGIDLGGVDLTSQAAADEAVANILAATGRIDVLANVAGGFTWETLEEGDSTTWQRMFAINSLTCLNMTKAALPPLLRAQSARIVNIGASGAINAAAGMGSYAASKSAVHKLTESLAAELFSQDITVNAILPTIIDTPTNRADMPDADFSKWVQPQAVADAILFLASPAARAITGALIPLAKGG